jgi:antitoxin (DNA-binding transcriptional repressor) of toxin-antitoxin stability system
VNLNRISPEVLKEVESGEKIIITYGRNKKSVAALIPISEFNQNHTVKIGLLKGTQNFHSQGF